MLLIRDADFNLLQIMLFMYSTQTSPPWLLGDNMLPRSQQQADYSCALMQNQEVY